MDGGVCLVGRAMLRCYTAVWRSRRVSSSYRAVHTNFGKHTSVPNTCVKGSKVVSESLVSPSAREGPECPSEA